MCREQQDLAGGGGGMAGEALWKDCRPRHGPVPIGDGRGCSCVLRGEGPLWLLCGGQNEGEVRSEASILAQERGNCGVRRKALGPSRRSALIGSGAQ